MTSVKDSCLIADNDQPEHKNCISELLTDSEATDDPKVDGGWSHGEWASGIGIWGSYNMFPTLSRSGSSASS